MVHDWFFNAIIATTLVGISVACYKLPLAKNYCPVLSTFWCNAVALGISIAYIDYHNAWEGLGVSYLGLLWGFLFAISMIMQKDVLKKEGIETNALFPVNSSLSTIGTIIVAMLFLSESLSLTHAIGLLITIISVVLFSKTDKGFPIKKRVIIISAFIVVFSIISKYIQKKGATDVPMENYILSQYTGASITALVAFPLFGENKEESFFSWKYLLGSLLIGSLSYVMGRFMFVALREGTASQVFSVTPLYVFVTAFIGWWYFGENLTLKKVGCMSLGLVGVVLIKFY